MSTRVLSIASVIFLSGCSVVPPLEDATGVPQANDASHPGQNPQNGIFVADVVQRIKCELATAFDDRLFLPGTKKLAKGDGTGKNLPTWLADWTVKADLNLEANEQGSISPSGSYTAFRKSAVNTAAGPTTSPGTTLGTFQQFFSLGVTGSAGEQAVRNETLSFTLSLKELHAWYQNPQSACKAVAEQGLLGKLGINEWIDASLAPVSAKVLQAGQHKTPSLSPKASSPQITAPAKVPGGAVAAAASAQDVFAAYTKQTDQAKADVLAKILSQSTTPSSAAILAKKNLSLDDIAALSEAERKQLADALQVKPPPSPPLPNGEPELERGKLEQALKDADAAEADARKSYNSINSSIANIEENISKTEDAIHTYSGVSTAETTTNMEKTKQKLIENEKQAKGALSCAVQMICGDSYGDCSGFKYEDGSAGLKGTIADLCRQEEKDTSACPTSISLPNISGIVREHKCVNDDRDRSVTAPNTPADLIDKYVTPGVTAADQAKGYANTTKQLATIAQKLAGVVAPKAPDPPIDSIGHLIQFVVGYGGGISPSWTLIAWKGPGLNGPLFSGNVTRTHILQLALGSPNGGGQSSSEQGRILNNQILLNLGTQ